MGNSENEFSRLLESRNRSGVPRYGTLWRDGTYIVGNMYKKQHDNHPLRILIVEDSSERLEYFGDLYAGHSVLSADSCEDALRLYTGNDFDLIHLDFDLGPETSEAFAGHLAKGPEGCLIVIHSSSPVGALVLHEMIPSSLVVPIARLRQASPALSLLKRILASAPSPLDVKAALERI